MNERIRQHEPGDFVNELVIVRAPGRDVRTDPEVRRAVDDLVSELEATRATQSIRTFYADGDAPLVSPEKDATVLAIGMGPDAEEGIKRVIEVVERVDAGPFRGGDHRRVHRRRGLPHDLEQGSEGGRALLRPPRVAARPPVRLRRSRRLARPAAARDRRDHGRACARRAGGPELEALVLRRQHAHRDGARARGRLLALHRFSLPRGAWRGSRQAGGDRGGGTDGEPSGSLQRLGLRDRAPRDAARSRHDHAQPRRRSRARRDHRGRAATTLLPAVLAVLGDRVDALRLPFLSRSATSEGRFWGAIVARVQRAPVVSLVVSVGVLVRSPCRRSTCARARRESGRSPTAMRRRTASSLSSASSASARSTRSRSSSTATRTPCRSRQESSACGHAGRGSGLPGSRGLGRPERRHHDRRGARRRRQP